MKSLRITRKEAEKVMHDINADWHVKYAGMVGGGLYDRDTFEQVGQPRLCVLLHEQRFQSI